MALISLNDINRMQQISAELDELAARLERRTDVAGELLVLAVSNARRAEKLVEGMVDVLVKQRAADLDAPLWSADTARVAS